MPLQEVVDLRLVPKPLAIMTVVGHEPLGFVRIDRGKPALAKQGDGRRFSGSGHAGDQDMHEVEGIICLPRSLRIPSGELTQMPDPAHLAIVIPDEIDEQRRLSMLQLRQRWANEPQVTRLVFDTRLCVKRFET